MRCLNRPAGRERSQLPDWRVSDLRLNWTGLVQRSPVQSGIGRLPAVYL